MKFEEGYFQKMQFTPEQIRQFLESADHDLAIARESKISDVVLIFSYNALIKIGIALIAQNNYRVRSNSGHHIKIIDKMSQILKDETIPLLGNKMRRERNQNLYDCIAFVSDRTNKEYLIFVEKVFKKVKRG